jgi:large subunit ribosomal protein L5
VEKIIVNSGIGRIATATPGFTAKVLPAIIREFSLLTGQRPVTRLAKKSIASFKVREGDVIGVKTTLRGRRMVDFLERLTKVVLPRLRDFKGIDLKNIDSHGSLSIGLRDHLVFPEVAPEESQVNFGLQITIVPAEKKRAEAIAMYRELGVPLKKSGPVKDK